MSQACIENHPRARRVKRIEWISRHFSFGLRERFLPALDKAMATAWSWLRPSDISALMFRETVFWDDPFFNGMTIGPIKWSPEFSGCPIGSRCFAPGNIFLMTSPEGGPASGIRSWLVFSGLTCRSHLLVPEPDKFVLSVLKGHDHTLFGRMVWRTLGLVDFCQAFAFHNPFDSLWNAGHAFTVIWP